MNFQGKIRRSRGLVRLQLALLLVLAHISVNAQVKNTESQSSSSIFPKGQLAPASNFTGKAWVHPLISADSVFNIPVSSVTFEPGARTFWHRRSDGIHMEVFRALLPLMV
ncbi:hypothetical protein [Dyadobacter sp. CY351]|uniref:hypothetical protein n=1 Tax=Dyadobacter sp. CY351 TaxID=2909337 RepID=UPI001F1DFC06|nr:hypothetical protein [Dyadobacter sp. CY351]MCF2518831.1 hypothetical protein [Dyadobacter sp. CY351]